MFPNQWPEIKVYANSKVLVIGGSGFIGINLILELTKLGAQVTAVSRGLLPKALSYPENVSVFNIDIRDKGVLDQLVVSNDIIFIVAGSTGASQSNETPLEDLKSNLIGQYNILESCRSTGSKAKIIFASSRLVYGKATHLPVDELAITDPTSFYAAHNLLAEKYHLLFHRLYGIATTIFRVTVPYGVNMSLGNRNHGVVNNFITKAIANEDITIYGNGEQIRDIIYIKDLVNAFLLAGVHPQTNGEVFNVGSGQPLKLKQIVETIIEVAGKGNIRFVPWPYDAQMVETGDFYSDISKISKLLDWSPCISLKEGVALTIDYYNSKNSQ